MLPVVHVREHILKEKAILEHTAFSTFLQISTFPAVTRMYLNIDLALYIVLKKEESPCQNNTETCKNKLFYVN